MKTIYICGPLAGNIGASVNRAMRTVARLMQEYRNNGTRGIPLFMVPHLILNGMTFNTGGEIDRKWGMECCLHLVGLSDELVVLGNRMTPGMADEVRRAHQKGIKVTRRRDL